MKNFLILRRFIFDYLLCSFAFYTVYKKVVKYDAVGIICWLNHTLRAVKLAEFNDSYQYFIFISIYVIANIYIY